jgi:hypothetical protein
MILKYFSCVKFVIFSNIISAVLCEGPARIRRKPSNKFEAYVIGSAVVVKIAKGILYLN